MASNIGGATIHGWGNITWTTKRGVRIAPHENATSDDISALSMKCGALRFLFIDEVEATGAETLGQLEENVRLHISSKKKYSNTLVNVCAHSVE